METFLILCTIITTNWNMKTSFERFLTSSVQQCSNYHNEKYTKGLHQWESFRIPRDTFLLEQKCGREFKDCPKVGTW